MYNAVCDFVSNSEPLRKTSEGASNKMWRFMQGEPMIQTAQKILLAA